MNCWPLEPLGSLVSDVSRKEPVNPEQTYKLLGMRSAGKGPFLRESVAGSDISATALNRVSASDFIYSRLFAWQGAFGVIPKELEGCYVSNEFPIFTVNPERIDIAYLAYWFQLPSTLRKVEADCTGSTPLTRNRFKEKYFKELQVPVPPLSIQQAIVSRLDGVAARLDVRRQAAKQIESDLQAALGGIFKQLVAGATRRKMNEVAPLIRRPVKTDLDAEYPELGVRSFGRGLFEKPVLRGDDLTWQKLFRIERGDIVFSNIKAWEGAFAVARAEHHGMVGSHRYLTCVPDPSEVTADFVYFYLQTPQGLAQVEQASPGSADRNRTLRQRDLGRIDVPVPSLQVQHWFDSVQAKARAVKEALGEIEAEAESLIPSILDHIFEQHDCPSVSMTTTSVDA